MIEHRSEKKNQNADVLLKLFPEQYIKNENSIDIE